MIAPLKTSKIKPKQVQQAVDYAFTLVAGWQKKDKSAIEAALEELRASASHNEMVYVDVAAALADLDAKRSELETLRLEVEKDKVFVEDEAARFAKINHNEASQNRQKAYSLARDQDVLDKEKIDFHEYSNATSKMLDDRQKALQERESKIVKAEKDLADGRGSLSDSLQAIAEAKADMNTWMVKHGNAFK